MRSGRSSTLLCGGLARAARAVARLNPASARVVVKLGHRRLRPRLVADDDRRVPAADARAVHELDVADRGSCSPPRALFAAHAAARDRPVERHLPHAARPAPAVHARRARPDRILPRADGVHAEHLDDGAARSSPSSSRTTSTSRPTGVSTPTCCPERSTGGRRAPSTCSAASRSAVALIGGGALFHLWQPCAVPRRRGDRHRRLRSSPVLFLREDGGHGRVFEGVGHVHPALAGTSSAAIPTCGSFLIANAAWEGTFAGARTFVVLYITVGLGEPLATTTFVLAAVAGRLRPRRARRGPDRRPLRPRPRDHWCLGRLRPGAARRRARDPMARVVSRDHLRRRDLRGRRA